MKNLLSILLISLSVSVLGQNGITIKVEKLSQPDRLLPTKSQDYIYKGMILSDIKGSQYRNKQGIEKAPFNIVAKCNITDSLVNFGYHSFFRGMYYAYADHRPFVLSPDMIWLLINQGFARHVNANAEKLRKHFVDHTGKLSLIVRGDDYMNLTICKSNNDKWEKIFPKFTNQIAEHTGKELMEVLTSDFSTTTPIEKVASEITIMEAMEPYFEFIVITIGCGIPKITLKGTPEDWEKVLDKTKKLSKYELGWWTKELIPILKKFVKASKGQEDKAFWRNMFKYHSSKQYGAPKKIDGWIVKFFPYDKEGKRNNMNFLMGEDNLPNEVVKVDLKFIEVIPGLGEKTTPLELWAGFIGLEQNSKDFTLTPKIGWMIRKKDLKQTGLKKKLESENNSPWGGIRIRVKEIPEVIYSLGYIKSLNVTFIDNIIISERLSKLKIGKLVLSGKISDSEIKRIKDMFPDTELIINRKLINREK